MSANCKSDQELRDELANESAKKKYLGDQLRLTHLVGYREGWDAARANDEEKEELKRTEKVYWMNRDAIEQLKEERDQLREEVEGLQSERDGWKVEFVKQLGEIDQLKAMAERLARKIEDLNIFLPHMEDDGMLERCEKIIDEALAEYRAMKKD